MISNNENLKILVETLKILISDLESNKWNCGECVVEKRYIYDDFGNLNETVLELKGKLFRR